MHGCNCCVQCTLKLPWQYFGSVPLDVSCCDIIRSEEILHFIANLLRRIGLYFWNFLTSQFLAALTMINKI